MIFYLYDCLYDDVDLIIGEASIKLKRYKKYTVESKEEMTYEKILNFYIFKNCTKSLNTQIDYIEIGPILTTRTAWSSNINSIFLKSGIESINRVEKSYVYLIDDKFLDIDDINIKKQIFEKFHDKMTEEIYNKPIKSFDLKITKETNFDNNLDDKFKFLKNIEKEYSLAFNKDEIDYILNNIDTWENPLFVILDIAQSNSEHCRHHFFNGILNNNDNLINESLFDLVKKPLKTTNSKASLIAFSDNSSSIRGYESDTFILNKNGSFGVLNKLYNFTLTAETHNFPTAVCPFEGASTGIGGRIRDGQSTGRGSIPIASSAGYCVGDLSTNDVPINISKPLDILIEASNGASDYGNKFGEPIILGFTRSFKYRDSDQHIEWLKPIMFTGGIGFIDTKHVHKLTPQKKMLIAKIGGPVYRIGIGGGSASSRISDNSNVELDFNSVQRGDPEMAQKLNRVIRKCIDLGEENPILSIHDQGAGGNGNVIKEIISGQGANINLGKLTLGDKTLTDVEIWLSEYQESNAILIDYNSIDLMKNICSKEGVHFDILGEITGDGLINISNNEKIILKDYKHDDKVAKRIYKISSKQNKVKNNNILDNNDRFLDSYIKNVFGMLSVGSKRFLTNKVDRSVSGLIAQQQCVGQYHTPLSNFGLISQSYFPNKNGIFTGCVTSIGEQPIFGICDVISMVHKTFSEALLNIIWCFIDDISNIRCSANWMWPIPNKDEQEGYKMYIACKELSHLMTSFDISIDGGKDSLSMATKHKDNLIKSPGSLVLSMYARCPNIYKKVTPDIKRTDSTLYFIDLSEGNMSMSGCSLYQFENIYPDIEGPKIHNIKKLKDTFSLVQELISKDLILSGHDKSDGGLITTIFEMCMSSNHGFSINVPENVNVCEFLFNEEIGIVIEVKNDSVISLFKDKNINVYPIAKILKNKDIEINQGSENLVKSNISWYRLCWESISYKLEQEQCNLKCVNTEYLGIILNNLNCYDYNLKNIIKTVDKKFKINVAIVREEGSNSDREIAAAFYHAGANVMDVTTRDLYSLDLSKFNGIVYVGGFSFSDVMGSGLGWASLLQNLSNKLLEFYRRKDTFSLGVCNGCQLMIHLLDYFNWIDLDDQFVHNSVKLLENDSERFESRFSEIKVNNTNSIFLQNIRDTSFGMWSAHKEGKFSISSKYLNYLHNNNLIPLQYSNKFQPTNKYPFNPNGSVDGIAAISSKNGRHLAIMPHPERSFLKWQIPWISENNKNTLKDTNYTTWFNIFNESIKWCESFKKVLVLGNGSREHVIINKLAESKKVKKIYSNSTLPIEKFNGCEIEFNSLKTHLEIKNFCIAHEIDMVVVGPEKYLVEGIVDYLEEFKIKCFGPKKLASKIEGSKHFSKQFMEENNIPTPSFKYFSEYNKALDYLNKLFSENRLTNNFDKVIKVSGLAYGKGVVLPNTYEEAFSEIKEIMVDHKFGDVSNEIIIEDKIYGEEVSVFAFCNGHEAKLMPQAKDYKRALDEEEGLNTGGMGSITPVNILSEGEIKKLNEYMNVVVKKLNYVGVLYAGVMKTKNNFYILEFNCRFGDPETQVVLQLLNSDLFEIFEMCVNGEDYNLNWSSKSAANIVLSHEDYPSSKLDNYVPVSINERIDNNISLYYGSLLKKDNKLFTNGGRVMSVVSCDNNISDCLCNIYNNIHKIKYKGLYFRRDIGIDYLLKKSNKEKTIKIAIIGSTKGTSMKKLMEMRKENNIEISVIISNRAKSGILEQAKENLIPNMFLSSKNINREEYDENILKILSIYNVDYIFLIGYMKIVTNVLIDAYRGRIFNIHPSLLPKYSGLMDMDVHKLIINSDDKFIGCTLHEVDENIDKGRIVMQKQIKLSKNNSMYNPILIKSIVQSLEKDVILDFINIVRNKSFNITYKNSGVDIDKGNRFVEIIKKHLKTNTIGGFGGIFDINNTRLCASTDGVGTKLELAKKLNKYDTIGIDLVAMCVNDILVQGATPLFFLDYIAIDKINLEKCEQIILGIIEGCKQANCKLLGGETAEMPSVYPKDGFDLAGFSVGNIPIGRELPNNIAEGDIIYGLKSSGLHSNGFSLVRKLIEIHDYPNVNELLEPTIIYVDIITKIRSEYNVKGLAHITGGGLIENIPRVLPKDLTFSLDYNDWKSNFIFKWIQEKSGNTDYEMLKTFNCGVGMVVILPENYKNLKFGLFEIGKITKKK